MATVETFFFPLYSEIIRKTLRHRKKGNVFYIYSKFENVFKAKNYNNKHKTAYITSRHLIYKSKNLLQ